MRIIMLSALVLGALTASASAEPSWDTIAPWGSGGSNDGLHEIGMEIGQMAEDVTTDLDGLSEAIVAPSYAAGVGSSAKSIMEFKAHEPKPTGPSSRTGHSSHR